MEFLEHIAMPTITSSKIWALAWPMILSNISVPLLGLVDTAVLGHLPSPDYLAAVAVGSAIIAIIYWGFGFLRMGTTGATANAFGTQYTDHTAHIFFSSCLLALGIAFLITLFHPWLFYVALWSMNVDQSINLLADEYLSIRLLSAPAALLNFVIIGWMVGVQKPRLALMTVVLCNGTNILLDLYFVIFLGMTSNGVAWATVIAEYASCVFGLWLVMRHINMRFNKDVWREAFRVNALLVLLKSNAFLFIRTIALLLTMAYFTKQGATYGTVILAANALLMQLAMLVSYGLDGFANAAEALVGEAIGKRRQEDLYVSMRGTAKASLWVAAIFSTLLWLGQSSLIHLLTTQQAIIEAANTYFVYVIVFPIVAVWSFWLDGVFIGAGRNHAMMWSMLFSSALVFVGLLNALEALGNHGLWLAYLGFITARGLSLGVISYRYTKLNAWFKSS
ncbi:MAG TPA: MATE family efflux transporter [Pseudomonadales bacterium]|nr:MATE family efflux transporter [Pseudomonadales bacterium]